MFVKLDLNGIGGIIRASYGPVNVTYYRTRIIENKFTDIDEVYMISAVP